MSWGSRGFQRERSVSVVAVAVLVHAVLGFVLACHLTTSDTAETAAYQVVVAPVVITSSDEGCPGCLLDAPPAVKSADPETEQVGAVAPCPPERPCQHRPADQIDPGPGVLGAAGSRDVSAALLPCPDSQTAGTPEVPGTVSAPVVPPAVLSPVAVLGVDRN